MRLLLYRALAQGAPYEEPVRSGSKAGCPEGVLSLRLEHFPSRPNLESTSGILCEAAGADGRGVPDLSLPDVRIRGCL